MQTFFEIVLIITGFLSLIPVVNMFRNRNDHKYACLKVLIYSTFFWTFLIFIERLSTNTLLIYYSGMLRYPLKLLFAALMLCTIFQYIELKFPKSLKLFLSLLILADLILALTNSQTLLMLDLKYANLVSFNDLYTANNGIVFIYHLVISYAIALGAIILLFVFLAKHKGVRQYKEVTRMMAVSVLAVLAFNLLQLFLFIVNVDLTYISLVFVAYILYDVIYRKDMIFNLRTSGRSEILANMREMYILTDANKKIIEISPLLLEKYSLIINEIMGKPLDLIVSKLADRVTLYSEYNMDEESYEGMDHYHLREKEFKLNGMNEYGYMMLLYDETQVYNLLRELNHLSNYDSMTGLNNRNYIEHKIKEFGETEHVGVFSLDLNGLKINNDYLGHERGDYLLKSISKKIKEVFKDIQHKEIARIGGDEFIIIVRDIKKEVLDKKKIELLDICENKDIEKTISVSIGLAYDEVGDFSIYSLIQKADALMYDMKSKVSKAYQEKMIEYIKLQDKYMR